MTPFPRLSFLAAGLLAGFAFGAPTANAAGDDLVVVDQKDLDAYWRVDPRRVQSVLLREGPERYGCMALPFVIETDGRVAPGNQPLLARIAQPAGVQGNGVDALFIHVIGSLPPFEPTWGTPPKDAIYSSRAIVIGDARLAQRLGPEKWARVHEELERACRIDDLAGWLGRHPDQVVTQSLPADPEQLLSAPPGPPR